LQKKPAENRKMHAKELPKIIDGLREKEREKKTKPGKHIKVTAEAWGLRGSRRK